MSACSMPGQSIQDKRALIRSEYRVGSQIRCTDRSVPSTVVTYGKLYCTVA